MRPEIGPSPATPSVRDCHRLRRAPRPSTAAVCRPRENAGAQDDRGRPAAMRPAWIPRPPSHEADSIPINPQTDRDHAGCPDGSPRACAAIDRSRTPRPIPPIGHRIGWLPRPETTGPTITPRSLGPRRPVTDGSPVRSVSPRWFGITRASASPSDSEPTAPLEAPSSFRLRGGTDRAAITLATESARCNPMANFQQTLSKCDSEGRLVGRSPRPDAGAARPLIRGWSILTSALTTPNTSAGSDRRPGPRRGYRP
jgi:hypothetical protein